MNEDEEENEDYREGKLRFAGGRGEAATYDEGDQEDRYLAARLQAQSMAAEDPDLDPPVGFYFPTSSPYGSLYTLAILHRIDNLQHRSMNRPLA